MIRNSRSELHRRGWVSFFKHGTEIAQERQGAAAAAAAKGSDSSTRKGQVKKMEALKHTRWGKVANVDSFAGRRLIARRLVVHDGRSDSLLVGKVTLLLGDWYPASYQAVCDS